MDVPSPLRHRAPRAAIGEWYLSHDVGLVAPGVSVCAPVVSTTDGETTIYDAVPAGG